jgi:phosphatidylserine decarboxylase
MILFIIIFLLVIIFVYWRFFFFLRNPERIIPRGDSILSAADGYVVYVRRIKAGTVPISIKKGRNIPLNEIMKIKKLKKINGYLIGTYMSAFSVHHNRIPVTGKIIFKQHYHSPKNLSMVRMKTNLLMKRVPYENDCEHLIKNERLTIGIENNSSIIFVTQIADAWIDRIIADVKVGDKVQRGQLYGLIRFGSQVDIFIPDSFNMVPDVKAGEYIRAGETILAKPVSGGAKK